MHFLLTFTIVGIVAGASYAIAASGLVVTYTTSGIFNFAHGAIGMFMAFVYWELTVNRGWPTPLALVVVLFVLAPLMGAVIERVLMRKLHGRSTGVSIVVTLALLVILLGLAQSIWPPQQARSIPQFFVGHFVKLAGVRVAYHDIIIVIVALGVAGLLRLLFTRSRLGVTMRAVVDDRELAALNGAYPERIAQASWALGSMLAAAAGILIASQIYSVDHLILTLLVINAYAAAILGRLRSLPLTFLGALLLGLFRAFAIGAGGRYHIAWLPRMEPILPTVFLLVVLLFLPQARLRAGRVVGMRVPRVPGLRQSLVAAAAFVGVMALVSTRLSEFWTFNLALALTFGLVMLSLVLLTGYGGQVSLMQMTFVAVGSVVMGHYGGSSLLGVLLAAAVAAVFGALVALPALRLHDLYLALATFALALVGSWALTQPWLLDQGGILKVERLKLLGIDFRSMQSQLILLSVAFALAGIVVLAIRRSAYGRRLTALNDSPVACATIGLNQVATKAIVFAASAAIAGLGGALYGGLHNNVTANDFVAIQSLFVFLVAMFGGVTTVIGALFGGAFLALVPELQRHIPIDNIQPLGIGIAAIALAENPNGFGGTISDLGELIRSRLRRRPAAPPVSVTGEADVTIPEEPGVLVS